MTPSFPGTEPAPGLVVSTHLRTAAGSPLPVEVTLTNNATAPRVLAVGALGIDAAWLPAPMRTAVLEPGQSTVVTLVVSPTQGTVPASYPFAFTVQALDPATGRPSGAAAVMVDSTLVVNPRNQLKLELRPRSTTTVSSRKVKLALRNTGNEPARVTLDVKTSPRVRVRFRKKVVEVLPGATELVRGRATVTHRRLFGGTEHHTYTVSASGTESLRHVEGSVTQHPLVGTMLMKAVALLSVLAIWIGAAVIFIPQLAHKIGDRSSETSTTQKADDGNAAEDGGGGGGDDAGGSDSGGSGGDQGGKGKGGKGGKGGGTQQAADVPDNQIALTGTVAGDQPAGVRVSLEPTSLVDERAQGGVGVGVPKSELGRTGLSPASSFLNRALPTTPAKRTSKTSADGSWAFAGVRKPGYYLLTFTKNGFQKQSFVVDSSSEASAEPLEVDLAAGEGTLSGTVTGPNGNVGGATVTITDGTNTLTTSSNSRGRVGHWEVKGLSTPGSYVVQATKPSLSSESRMVSLAAGGTATADLHLRNGVASLVGKVRAIDESGGLAGVGGATVTVTAEDGTERTATTLTQGAAVGRSNARVSADFVGTYTVPGLPAPGTYVVTLGGPGLQTQTTKVKLKPGQARAGADADLTRSSGSVTGTITGVDGAGLSIGGLVGTGLTLANADNTYKTMSTSEPLGSFLFDGVAPGTYSLQTAFFGFVSDHVTVTVRAGKTATVNRQIGPVEGGVLAPRSSVMGRVIDGSTTLAVNCPPDTPCVLATVKEPGVEDDTSDDHTYTTEFLPTDQFTLPEPHKDPGGGLLPGLHTVTVSAPHYASTTASIQIGDDETADIGTLALLPAPRIVGSLTTVIGSPQAPGAAAGTPANTCIWAVPATATGADATVPAGCNVAGAAAECQHRTATFDPGDTRVCAYVTGTDSYSLEVPKEGSYKIHVNSADPEYLSPAVADIVLQSGVTRNQSFSLNRLGRLNVTVRQVGDSGLLEPAVGPEVTLQTTGTPPEDADATPIPATATTVAGGTMQFVGVQPGAYTVASTNADGEKDSRPISIGLNQEKPVRLNLTAPIRAVVGRVTSTFDGGTTNVKGATVKVTAPVHYGDDDVPTQGTVTMKTQSQGCFIIESAGTDYSDIAGPGGCSWTTPVPDPPEAPVTDDSRGKLTFLTNMASLVEWSAPGYVSDSDTQHALSTSVLNSFVLVPKNVDLGTVNPVLKPADATFDWSSVTFTVVPDAGPTGEIALTATGTGANTGAGAGRLVWNDRRVGARNVAIPGTYRITAKRTGYLVATGTLVCPVPVHDNGSDTCTWADGPDADQLPDPLRLDKRSSLEVTAKDGTAVVPNASYTLSGGPDEPQTLPGGTGGVTFTGLDPTVTDYKVSVRAAGYDFGSAGDPLAIKCGADDHSSVVLEPGATAVCSVVMKKLGTISGTVNGLKARYPKTGDNVTLGGAVVTVAECTQLNASDKCTGTSATNVFTTTANGLGQFSVTGTADKEGLDPGKKWLVSAEASGYELAVASGVKPGMLVTFPAGSKEATADLVMTVKPVSASIVLRLGTGTTVSGATVELRRSVGINGATELAYLPVAGTYDFKDVVPGVYVVSYSGAGLRAGTSEEVIDVEGKSVSINVARAVNTAYGTVSASDGGVIENATVWLCATAACTGDKGAPDAFGAAMETRTDATGAYSIRTVPDGDYWVRITKLGYRPKTLGKFGFDQTIAALQPVSPTLVLVTRKVVVTVTTPWANNDLAADGVTASLTRVGGGATAYTNVALTAAGSKKFTASFEQVKWGCWTFALSLPNAKHKGSQGALSGGPTETTITCTGTDRLTVPSTDDETDATATVAVDEGRLDLSAVVSNYTGFAAADPGDVRVKVTRAGDSAPWYDNADFGVGGAVTSIWVPTGGAAYTVTVSLAVPSVFWPAVSVDKSVPAAQPTPDGGVAAPLTLLEKAATVDVVVSGAPPAGATLTLTPPPGATVPPGYLPSEPTGTDGKVTLTLPGGKWTVTAAIPGDSKEGTVDLLLPQAYPLPISVVWPKATGASTGAPGSFTPSTYDKPANLAAMNAGVTASPTTAWTGGQYVVLGNGSNAYWDGAAWKVGKAPIPATGATAGKPGDFTPSGAALPANLAAVKADVNLGSAAAWTKDQYVVLGDGSNAYWDGTTWKAGKVP